MFVTCPIKNSVYFFGSFLINKRLSFTGVSSALSVLFVLQRILLKLGGQLTRTFILTAERNHPYVRTHFKRLSFTGVSSALSVLFVFPVQALTDTFNYSFRCLVETKVYIFHLEVITLRVLKLPVILVYYVSSLSFLFSKNTFKTSGPTHKNI